jgi:hypothetical protein
LLSKDLQFVIFDQTNHQGFCNLSFLTKQIITPASQYSKLKVVKLIRVKRINKNRKAVSPATPPKTINYPETTTTWLQACFTKLAFVAEICLARVFNLCLA